MFEDDTEKNGAGNIEGRAVDAGSGCEPGHSLKDDRPIGSEMREPEPERWEAGNRKETDSREAADSQVEDAVGRVGLIPETVIRPWTSSWARDVLVSILVSAFIIVFLYQPVRVEGTSMLPMLQDQDRLFINKIAYRVGEIHRGDVVVFLYPHDHSKSYIKRVIAVGGDELRIDHGRVWVNGQQLKEGYVPLRFTDERSQPETIVPPHEYFVMGDHRSISSDSRDFGPVERDLIYGKAAFVYWPMDQMGVVR